MAGTLYGTTEFGGASGIGTVFSVTPNGTEKVLYSFKGVSKDDGARPLASLIDSAGRLYGTTESGGANDDGTVFSVTPNGTEKVLYSFKGASDDDGAEPFANLIRIKGEFYGTTFAGGGFGGFGTVFSVATDGTEKVLYRFAGGPDGAGPTGGLVNVNGTLYGTTQQAGASGNGAVFSVTTNGKETVLYSFGDGKKRDGSTPAAGLLNIDGTLYGTTVLGGGRECLVSGCGVVFSVTTTGKERVLHSFIGGADGANPQAALTNLGNTLYGTTNMGGSSGCAKGCGTVFSVTTAGIEKVLHSFSGRSDGWIPSGGLIDVRGTLYGTTDYGGSGCNYSGCGTIFTITN